MNPTNVQIPCRDFLAIVELDMEIDEILGEPRQASIPTKSVIYVWGYNQSGQTGRRDKDGNLRIPKQLPSDLFGCPIGGGNSRWRDIACGREHTAAVASDGSLFTWGIFTPFFLYNRVFPNCLLDVVLLCFDFYPLYCKYGYSKSRLSGLRIEFVA